MTSTNKWAIRGNKSFVDLLKTPNPGSLQTKSQAWLQTQAQTAGGSVRTDRLMGTMADRLTTRMQYGRMYLFWYDPKLKVKLPYYDRFPLVLPIDPAENGFLGLNMHYLPYMARAKLMDALYSTLNNKNMDEKTKIKANYSILKGVRKFRYYRPCIKHYLTDHIQSRFLNIPADQWDIALFLPLERFEKATKKRVFDESMDKIWRSN